MTLRSALSPSSVSSFVRARWASRPTLRSLVAAPDGTSPLLATAAFLLVLWMIGQVVAPFFEDMKHWGWHDWDMVSSFRYLVVKSLKAYHQLPFWNPYECGGYTAWGYVESDTNLISPWLPLYLIADERIALRLEVVGTAFFSAWGTWLLAGRFTRSAAARAFACVVFVVNGRWALQTASGHLMHCYYAWLPWVFYFFDRALDTGTGNAPLPLRFAWRKNLARRFPFACAAGAFVALMVYTGAIYPLPQTVVALLVYALLLSASQKSPLPLATFALVVAIGGGLGAPKLLPIMDAFSKAPRLVESKETMDLGAFITMMTSRDQDFDAHPAHVPQWGWHEWGMYIGWVPFVAMIAAAIFVKGKRQSALKWTAVVLTILGFGTFHDYAPWTLLHQVSIFRSQHVPSRWLYPAALLFGVVVACGIDKLLARFGRRRLWVDLALLVGVAAVATDIALVAQLPMKRVFWMEMSPSIRPETESFHQEASVLPEFHYVRRDWSIPSLPAMVANVGVLECYAVVPMSVYAKNAAGVVPGQGAKGRGDPNYRGEVFLESGKGSAKVLRWTPNEVDVEVEDATPGDLLVMNQNYDPGWSANGATTINQQDTVATKLESGGTTVVRFRYRPRLLAAGAGIFLLTLCGMVFGRRRLSVFG